MFDSIAWLEWPLFAVSFCAIVGIFALSALAAMRSDFQFFPPPSKTSWQHRVFMALFRLFLYPLVGLTIVSFNVVDEAAYALHYGFGGLLLLAGFGLAFWITAQMGWRNAFGEKRGLVTDGWFGFSRNPVYVATWIGLIGWGFVASQLSVSILLAAWALLYLLAPFVEEPWLEAEYGEAYRAYKEQTRPFL